jgi:hypothetical protein
MSLTAPRLRRMVAMPRSSLLVPALAALGSVAFFAWKPGVAISAVASPRAAGFTIGVGLLTIALGWALPRLGRGALVTAATQIVPVALAFVVTVLPSLRTITINDPVPSATAAAAVPVGPGSTAAPGSAAAAGAAPGATASTVLVSRSAVTGIHHRASGTVLLLRLADGSHVIRLGNLDVEPGPDYFVFVVPGAGREDPDGGNRLHRLRGNRGNQNYPVPSDVGLTRPLTMLIWCRAFSVPVAAATLR